jgi:Rrf2 family transcriptional regulator, iron-sulfur cluster assembly transcription factor
MLTQTARYALQILGYLRSRGKDRVRADEIARATGIPANYLSKILNQLRKAGIVDAQKGWGGGFVLRREALRRPITDVVEVFEGRGAHAAEECAFGLERCDERAPCPLHPFWESIRETYGEMLRTTSIGDLTALRR